MATTSVLSLFLILGATSVNAQKLTVPTNPISTQPVNAGAADASTAALAQTLGVSLAVAQQIQSIEADKLLRTPAQQKLSSDFIYAERMARGFEAAPGVGTLAVTITPDSAGRVEVVVAGLLSPSLNAAITQLGGTIVDSASADSVTAILPLHNLETLAGRSDVFNIRPYAPPKLLSRRRKTFAEMIKARPLVPYLHRSTFTLANRNEPAAPPSSAGTTSTQATAGRLTIKNSNTGTLDEGYNAHNVSAAVSAYGVTGTGIKIGVMSDGDLDMANSQASNDLPPTDTTGVASGTSVTVAVDDTQSPPVSQDGPSNNTGEGTAMMCIVHDMAPNAKIYFASAFNGEAQFAKNILLLRLKYHCDIICDDVAYGDEPVFADGIVAQAVNQVVADGALYFSSAGNEGHQTSLSEGGGPTSGCYEGDFVDGGSFTINTTGGQQVTGNVNAFASGVNFNTVTNPPSSPASVSLTWSDPPTGFASDYDFFCVNGTTTYSSSTSNQSGYQPPIEFVNAKAGYKLIVVKTSSGSPRALHIDTSGSSSASQASLSYYTNGQTHGHNSTANGFGVAATVATNKYQSPYGGGPYPGSFVSSDVSEFFSSDGPRQVFYNVSGGPNLQNNVPPSGYTLPESSPTFTQINSSLLFAGGGGTTRIQPALTAADGVSTGVANNEFDPFYGTSAAAPHAASVAALVKSYSAVSAGLTINGPLLSVSEMHTVLQGTAIDIEKAGVDSTTGYGIVMPTPAIAYLTSFLPVGSITAATQSSTGANITWNTNLAAGSTVNYGTTQSLVSSKTNAGESVTSHSVQLSGLQPGTLYYYQVVSATPTNSVSYTDPTTALHTFATSAAATAASLAVTGYSVTSASGIVTAVVTISNRGTATANGVQVTTATLGSASTTASLPVPVGTIAAGSSTTVSLTFTSPGSGTVAVLRAAGSDSLGDTFSFSTRISVP